MSTLRYFINNIWKKLKEDLYEDYSSFLEELVEAQEELNHSKLPDKLLDILKESVLDLHKINLMLEPVQMNKMSSISFFMNYGSREHIGYAIEDSYLKEIKRLKIHWILNLIEQSEKKYSQNGFSFYISKGKMNNLLFISWFIIDIDNKEVIRDLSETEDSKFFKSYVKMKENNKS